MQKNISDDIWYLIHYESMKINLIWWSTLIHQFSKWWLLIYFHRFLITAWEVSLCGTILCTFPAQYWPLWIPPTCSSIEKSESMNCLTVGVHTARNPSNYSLWTAKITHRAWTILYIAFDHSTVYMFRTKHSELSRSIPRSVRNLSQLYRKLKTNAALVWTE